LCLFVFFVLKKKATNDQASATGRSIMKFKSQAFLLITLGFVLGLAAPQAWGGLSSFAQSGCRTFPETGYRVCGRFLDYWQRNGGLAQQGYPVSGEFYETSEADGKPYLVQYFERAVFELHPENRPPFDVLLTQLGTLVGQQRYELGFPTQQGVTPYYEDRTTPAGLLRSFYNAVTRREYERAYSYFEGAPNPDPSLAPPFAQFSAGYSNTLVVTIALVPNIDIDGAAGSLYAAMPVVLKASTRNPQNTVTYAGCYVLRRANDGVSPDPEATLWRIYSARLQEVPGNISTDDLLSRPCSR
jgi:hypothetical protein